MKELRVAELVLFLILGIPNVALAQEVIAGLDLLVIDPARSFEDLSGLGGMCGGCQVVGNPIIPLRGIPLGGSPSCPGHDLGQTDTVVRRLQDTQGLNIGGQAAVPIEIVALHLQSVQPFQVRCGAEPQVWTLDVTLAPSQPPGQLRIYKSYTNGGTFQSTLPVRPQFVFTRVDVNPPQVVCTPQPQDHIYQGQGPWVHDPGSLPVLVIPGCTTNFFPGIDGNSATIVGFGMTAPQGSLFFFPAPATQSDVPDGHEASALRTLLPNVPNPFAGTTTLAYAIDHPADVRLTVFNVSGQVVKTFVLGDVAAGQHHIVWDGRNDDGRSLGSGLYTCEVRVGGVRETRKILLLR